MGVLTSLLIGLSIAAIPGPIFFELVRRTLTKGYWSGVLLSVGEFIGNLTLLLLIYLGLSVFLENQIVKMVLYLIGSTVLIYLGVLAFEMDYKYIKKSYNKEIVTKSSILAGFGIAVTSPIVIAFWVSLSGSYLHEIQSQLLAYVNIFMIAFGFLIFFFTLAGIVHFTRHKISARQIFLMSRTFGIILVLFGLSFFYKFMMLMS
ncbi:hypothetical protein BVX95_01875 [archaeon D22]|nr:hypothetical protein BVX95_01875 [archaeon D22]